MRKRHAARTSDRQPIAWGYYRVSSVDQAKSSRRLNVGVGMSLEWQNEAICEYIARNFPDCQFTPQQHMIQDAESASRKAFISRPGGREIWDRAQPGDIVVCAKIDRTFRNMRDQAITVDEFSRRDVLMYFLDCPQMSGASGRLLANVLGSIAQFESERRSERVCEALAVLKKQKRRYWGGAKRAWGFRQSQNGRLIPFPEEQAIMRQVWRWKEVDRKTWHEIEYLLESQLCAREGREVLRDTTSRKPRVSPLHRRCKWNGREFTIGVLQNMHRVHQKWIEQGYMDHPLKGDAA